MYCSLQMVSLDSTESTGLFEATSRSVKEDSMGKSHTRASYDENDEEVAGVLGEEMTGAGDDDEGFDADATPLGTQPFEGAGVRLSLSCG